MLKIGKQLEIRAKGFEQPVAVSEVVGIGGPHKLSLVQTRETLVALTEEIPVNYFIAEGSEPGGEMLKGSLTKLSSKRAEVRLESPVAIFGNLEMLLTSTEGKGLMDRFIAKRPSRRMRRPHASRRIAARCAHGSGSEHRAAMLLSMRPGEVRAQIRTRRRG